MKQTAAQSADGQEDTRTPFQKFQDLTRHIPTTPKAESQNIVAKNKTTRSSKKGK